MTARIAMEGVGKRFAAPGGEFEALRDVHLDVADNEFVTLVGASGCGKSTLLRIVGGLESHTGGVVRVGGRAVRGPGRERAMIFQDYSLFPWLTVLENVRFARQLRAQTRGEDWDDVRSAIDRSHALLELMGLTAVRDSYPDQLSGGMRQRVAIARALLARPEVLLMDEPFGALDAQTREVMHDLILHLFQVERSTILFVTHDVDEAIYLADRVVVMAPDPGRIDGIFDVPLPPPLERHQGLKLDAAFLDLKRRLLERIRETSVVHTDLAALRRFTAGLAPR